MKKQYVHLSLMSLIFLSSVSPSLYAKEGSRLDRSIKTLEQSIRKLPRQVKNIIRCARGAEECKPQEVKEARRLVAAITASLATVIILSGLGIGVKMKQKGWGPLKVADLPAAQERIFKLTQKNRSKPEVWKILDRLAFVKGINRDEVIEAYSDPQNQILQQIDFNAKGIKSMTTWAGIINMINKIYKITEEEFRGTWPAKRRDASEFITILKE